jgi:predicted permease
MINTMVRMTTARTGFEPEGLLFVHLDLPSWSFATQDNPTRRAAFMDDVTVRVSDVPGVRSIGMGSATPFSGMTFMTGVELEGGIRPGSGNGGLAVRDDGGDLVWFSRMHVDPGYLATLGLPLVGGRRLGPVDSDAAQSVGLINETAANAYWPGESPLGKRIRESRGGAAGAAGADDDGWITIVGVVADFGHPGLPTQGMAELYLPMSQRVLPTLSRPTLLIRHDGSGAAAIEGVRRAIWEVDPELPIPAIATASQHLGASLAVPRFYAILLGSFAGLALLLAAVGIYGVVAHSVARRTREIGIRMALGARSATVGAMVARDGVLAVAAGLSIGIAGGVVASRLLVGLLYGVEPLDSLTCAAVAVALALVAGAAIAVPARRAMAADPVASMRAD